MSFPDPTLVEANGLKLAVYEQGSGMPVVMCHGFPELAYSWRHQMPAIAGAGFRAIAADQRGYGRTVDASTGKIPAEIEAYDMEHLTGDMVAMLDSLGIDKAIFCGHDWGGFVVWQMPLHHPSRVAGVIGVNTPFMPRSPIDPIEAMRLTMGEDMYIVYFQKPGAADRLFGDDIAKSLRFWYRKSAVTLEDFDNAAPDAAKNLALAKLFEIPESEWGGGALLTPEEAAYYEEAFTRTGFTGGLNWYRNFTRNWERSTDLPQRVDVPCLMISAANDVVLRPELADGMEEFCPDLEKHVIADCGHWTQAEKPDELNALIIDWLTRRFSE
ncbi:alpha/beta hydrolase [Pyruvatibacter sp.]|uniref:alpha/beta fold hydrolase n=1 Tax=Pyruvatibacter sp. TaxID=1981328 RepID=UPI0032EEFEDB